MEERIWHRFYDEEVPASLDFEELEELAGVIVKFIADNPLP